MNEPTDHEPTPALDPFDLLGELRPFVPGEGTAATDEAASTALFEEITMQTPTTVTARAAARRSTRRPPWRRPGVLVGAAAAVAAIVAGGLLSTSGRGPNAYAQMVAASEATAAIDSGRTTVSIDLREYASGSDDETGTVEMTMVYSGDDYELATVFDVRSAGDGSAIALESVVRMVDGLLYANLDGGDEWTVWDPGPSGGSDLGAAFGFQASAVDPDTMLDLLRAADDVRETADADGVTTYAGTLRGAAIEAIDPDRLPAGISMIAADGGNLPEEVAVTVEVADGRLRSVTLLAQGEFPGNDLVEPGRVDATIVTTYEDLGAPITIEAPPSDQVSELPGADPEVSAAVDVLYGYLDRTDSTCLEGGDEATADEQVPLGEIAVDAFVAAVGECLAAEGAPAEVLEAWETINDPLGLD